MNRIEFMSELEKLLQDMPQEERSEALTFYFDYFNDAGEENEQKVIAELVSPQKVAATIKADVKGQDASSEYSENGYTDTRFEKKDAPMQRNAGAGNSRQANAWTSKPLKIVLIILIAIAACTVVWPVLAGVFGVAVALLFAAFGLFIGLVIGSIALMITGFVIFIVGLTKIAVALPVALLTSGSGILIFILGLIATVASIKLCMVVYPAMIRGIVNLIRRPIYGKADKKEEG
ncbi:MAG: hypothetical protein PHQ72_00145 [Hespellia sp.]|nr:hypothetical protein [Hespellia sp.]